MSLELARKIAFEPIYRSIIESKLNPLYGIIVDADDVLLKCLNRCFYTAILPHGFEELPTDSLDNFLDSYFLYKKKFKYLGQKDLKDSLQRDHIVCMRSWRSFYCNDLAGESNTNLKIRNTMFPALGWLNSKLGHTPLELRLLYRRKFQQMNFPRDHSEETKNIIIGELIDIASRYKIDGLYPWQPHTFENSPHRKYAEEFSNHCYEVEEYFLNLNPGDRVTFIETHEIRWTS